MADIIDFLKESNAIEGIYDENSYFQALQAWNYLLDQKKLDASVILKTHKILMLNQLELRPDERGYFRKIQVYINGGGSILAHLVPEEIKSWCDFVNDPSICLNSEPWKYHHIMYEKIHPFVDGNGRTGRMFMNWQRLQAGLPILVIEENEKQDYYEWFD